ncbi:hypothetical protein BOW53_04645 [Solemya pervernicosa gill symbiont]|uniref:NfeD-like C-terminal domain-containing protein n=2 Tax=Gammaproteobacteria incertae sedis TaxID=118884 RepID=A0A1T2L865_9GAMM|nr:NfeD family protein [Candidatus Reidiella endopervernicosa]OOZ41271.1 hypothetical protein BOW53_04645 [Solemya pervernicosa gill symbiont]QKQ25242.1 NfeD family protein [Candidatus Reidiella endopervernicosa]
MGELLQGLDHWHWWILAVVLVILEIFAPGTFFMWMGISAAVVGLLVLVAPSTGWEYQVLIFAILSVSSVLVWRAWFKQSPEQTDQPNLNRRGHQYVGRIFTLEEPILNGTGKVKVDDTIWKIEGTDCEAGSKVEVVGVDNVVLKVELR